MTVSKTRWFLRGLLIVFVGVGGFRVYEEMRFMPTSPLEAAAEAHTVEDALRSLEEADAELDARGLTEGNTSVFDRTQANDIGAWRLSLDTRIAELRDLSPAATESERLGALEDLNQWLTNESGFIVMPRGMAVYPYNWVYAFILWPIFIFFALRHVVIPFGTWMIRTFVP